MLSCLDAINSHLTSSSPSSSKKTSELFLISDYLKVQHLSTIFSVHNFESGDRDRRHREQIPDGHREKNRRHDIERQRELRAVDINYDNFYHDDK